MFPCFLPRILPAFVLLPALFLLTLAPTRPTAAAEAGFVAYPCPIQGQEKAVVLGTAGRFQAACLALSTPHDPGPWPATDAGRIDGSSRFCPRAILTVLDRSGATTVRFLPAPERSFLADPTACCRAAAIAVDPADGQARIGTSIPAAGQPLENCFGAPAAGSYEDLYRWDGNELKFIESRRSETKPAQ